MKKKKWFSVAFMVAALAITASACAGKQPGGTQPGGNDGPKEDVYEDYNPNKQPGGDAFDYDGNYAPPELTIDGKGDDEQWQAITQPLATFGKKIDGQDAVSVKAYRGKDALFFLFEVKDPVLLTKGNVNDDAVTHGDSIELYIDTLADGGRSPQSDDYQINLGIHGKTRIMQGAGGQWGSWNGLIDYEADLKGTLNDGTDANDTGYSIEVMVPYRQIMIEKDDTIAVSFGQVDKVGAGDVSGIDKDWSWYGWTYGGTLREPQTPNNYVLLDKNNALIDRDEQEKAPADLAGYVKDTDGNPVEGATATVQVGGTPRTATTGADGYFVIEQVDSEGTYTVTVSKTGYLDGVETYTRAELRAANGGRVLKDFTITATAGLETTEITGTVKNVVNGIVAGATVTVKGSAFSTTTDANGAFSISGVPAGVGDVTLVVTKTGYGDSETTVKEADLVANDETALGDVNLNLPYADCGEVANGGGKEGANKQLFVDANVKIARSIHGVEFKFDSERILYGKVEIYIDTKTPTDPREKDATAWRLDLNDNGTIGGSHFAGGDFSSTGLVYTVVSNTSEEGYHATLLVPYSYLGITSLETFGISMGQFSTMATNSKGEKGDWDGWGPAQFGFVAPENPSGYVRVGAQNNLYKANNNDTMAVLSGNVGIAGVTVSAKGVNATSDANGAWSMNVPVDSEAITVSYSKTGYVPKTTTIAAGTFNNSVAWSENVTLVLHKVTISGTVTDQDGAPVQDVEVTITGAGGVSYTATTGSDGTYSVDNVTTFVDLTVTFTKDEYAEGTSSITVAQLAAGNTVTADKSITSLNQIKKITLTGKVVGIEGALEGATVSVNGKDLSATTLADGTFTLAEFEAVDSTLTVSKTGYEDATLTFTAEELQSGATSYNFADKFLMREYTQIGNAFGTKTDTFAHFVPYVTRGETAFEFKFVGSKAFTGNIEFFVDTKLSAGVDGRNSTDYRFNLYSANSISVENWGGSNTNAATLGLRIAGTDTEPEVYFTLPYAFLNVTRDEIIGVTFGQATTDGWDGWNYDTKGVDGLAFVDPAIPWDYIRIGKDNQSFWNAENKTLAEFDPISYNIHFGRKLDSMHAKVSRDATGIIFDFITFGDFDKHGSDREAILLYFDKGEPAGEWAVDYLYKIASDTNVYGQNSAWWLDGDGNKKGTASITRDSGITRISYKVLYSDLGIQAGEVVGFALVEGWLDGENNKTDGGYGGMIYWNGEIRHEMTDAANTATFIRIKADGTLVVANSNAAVTA